MNVYIANDGSVQINKWTRIFRGSHKVQNINMIGDFPDYSKVEIKIRLPDKIVLEDEMEFREKGHWTFTLEEMHTYIAGKVGISFAIYFDDKRLTTPPLNINIEDSILEEW